LPGVSNLAGISISLRAFDDSIREAYKTLFPGGPDKNEDQLDGNAPPPPPAQRSERGR
jgi:hypothetical protein